MTQGMSSDFSDDMSAAVQIKCNLGSLLESTLVWAVNGCIIPAVSATGGWDVMYC
jgi:hypothetical protein